MISENAIRNPSNSNQIALKWVLNRPPKTVKIDGTDQYYVFQYKSQVAMEWVREEHVERLLGVKEKTCNCQNGIYKQAFDYANQIDVNLWTCGNRHCD